MRRMACILWLTAAAAMTAAPAFARGGHVSHSSSGKHGKGWLVFGGILALLAAGGGFLFWKFRSENPDGTAPEFRDWVKAKALGAADDALTDDAAKAPEAVTAGAEPVVKAAPAPRSGLKPSYAAPRTEHAAPKAARSPVHGIDLATYAKLNAARNAAAAFDAGSLAPILLPYKLTPAQFREVETTWQERMNDDADPDAMRAMMDEFNVASAAAAKSAA